MGMAEQLLMAGAALRWVWCRFATTYAVFGTRRAYDFIHQVIAEENPTSRSAAPAGLTTGYGPATRPRRIWP